MLYSTYVNINTIDKVKKFNVLTNDFNEDLFLESDHIVVDAKSILGVFSLNLMKKLKFSIMTNNESRFSDLKRKFEEFVVE